MLKSGENFFNRFNKDAVAGLVPGGLPGDKRDAIAYFGGPLLAHMRNVERVQVELLPKDHESTSDSEAMEVDPLPRDVPEANDDVVMSSNDAPHLSPTPDHDPLPDSALKVVRYPSPTPDHNPLPDFVPSTTVFLSLPTPNPVLPPTKFGPIPDDDPLPDFVPSTMVFLPLPTPNPILPPINLGPISFPNSSITEAFPGQPAPEIAPEWNDFPMMFMPSEGTPAYNNDDVFLPSPQGSSFSSLEPEGSSFSSLDTDGSSLSLNAQAQSSGDGLDITNSWSESFMLQCYEQLLASFPAPNPSYLADGPPPLDLNMHPTESASLFTSPAAPPLHPSSGPAVPPSNEIVSANATMTAVRQKPTSDELPVKASRHGPLNKPAQQMPIPDIPRQAQNRKAPGSREVTTLVSIEPSPPPWQVQSLASMWDSTFGKDWDTLLEKWDAVEVVLIRENSLGKLPKKQPSVLKKWLDEARSFSDPLVISDIDQFSVVMVGWWNSLQPNWRQTTEGMPLQNYAGQLTCLRKGGQNGIVSVLFGLFWWRRNCDGPSEWSLLVSDVSNTFDALLNTTAPPKCRR
ncbi:uncharacterized protein ARMOST_22372 [Armillaria ostoyae]|uniref:Uncharacterized protein n=1 Tax=Armillaria ostoyae TaxID=47428 RepID=A0A284SCP1_ARMOS|nr:uncharacterized protein ARMOST_22372 [Armillaria ostoyae]